jgi:hypothetical protein
MSEGKHLFILSKLLIYDKTKSVLLKKSEKQEIEIEIYFTPLELHRL